MKVYLRKKRHFVRVTCLNDQKDEWHDACAWAIFSFYPDDARLTVKSNRGSLSNCFPWVKADDFLGVIASLREKFLREYLFKHRHSMNIPEVMRRIRSLIPYDGMSLDERGYVAAVLGEVETALGDGHDYDEALRRLCALSNTLSDLGISNISDIIVPEYTAYQNAVTEMFFKHVQPKVRELL